MLTYHIFKMITKKFLFFAKSTLEISIMKLVITFSLIFMRISSKFVYCCSGGGGLDHPVPKSNNKVVCYYTSWSYYRTGTQNFIIPFSFSKNNTTGCGTQIETGPETRK